MSGKLKNCPFCDGAAQRFTIEDRDNYPSHFGGDVIQCMRCYASTRVFFGEMQGLEEAWNTRASRTVGRAKDGLEEMSHEELDGELRSHGLDPAELDRNMLAKLEAKLKDYEAVSETPPERFMEMLNQFRVAVGTAKAPESNGAEEIDK